MASVVELEHQLRELRQKVESLAAVGESPNGFAYPQGPFTDRLRQILLVTRDLFPGPVRVELQDDPEVVVEPYVVFTVEAEGDPKEIVRRRCVWHERLRCILSNLDEDIGLSINPREMA
ncbi:MAG TPA: hypothetical protein VND64_06455 [Pirellulales bacterium]|nr:hypothetical protein [Pirellulales bacterium]